MRVYGILVVLIALMAVPRESFAQVAGAGEPSVLSAGDSLMIAVHNNPELSGIFGVRPDGTIGSPYYSSIQAAGLPIQQIEQQVRAYLAMYEQQNPRVIVDPLFLVAVGGEVRQPGSYLLGTGSTLTQAVLRAGGANERGALDRAILYRNGQRLDLNLSRPEASMGGMVIRSGDQIVIRPRREIFRNYVLPMATIAGATAAIMNAVDRQRR